MQLGSVDIQGHEACQWNLRHSYLLNMDFFSYPCLELVYFKKIQIN